MLGSLTNVKSAHYNVNASFSSEPRDADAKPLAVLVPAIAQKKEALKRDQQRLSGLEDIVAALKYEKKKNKVYPLILSSLYSDKPGAILDPTTHQQYGYRQEKNGNDFTLDIELETDAAARAYFESLENQVKYSDKINPLKEANKLIEIHDTTLVGYAYVNFSDVSPLPLGFDYDSMYQYLPAEIKAVVAVGGQNESDLTKSNDLTFNANGKLELGGTSFAAGLDVVKKADTFFVRLNEAPSFGFFDLAALKGKWIKAVPEDAYGTILGGIFYHSGDQTIDKQSARLLKQYQLVFQLLKEENLIQVKQEFPQIKEGKEKLYHYAITLDRSKLADFYQRLTQETKKEFGDDAIFTFNEETLTYLQGKDFAQIYDALEKNITLELWIDSKTFQPRRIAYSLRLVPPDSILKLKEKQHRFTLNVGLANVNQPLVVDVPPTTISVDEARMLLTGESLESIKYGRQVARVQAVRDAISVYDAYTGHHPATLSDLLKKSSEVQAVPSPSPGSESFSLYQLKDLKNKNKPFLNFLPKDIFTNADYVYTTDGASYTLVYQMKLPPKREDQVQDYQYDYIRKQYVEGTNTATEKIMSVEAGGSSDNTSSSSVFNARAKANDARIKSDVGQLRTLAEVYYDANKSSYSGVDKCFDAPTETTCKEKSIASSVKSLKDDLTSANGGTSNLEVNASATDYCISHGLTAVAAYSCVDSTGQSAQSATARCGTTAVQCP